MKAGRQHITSGYALVHIEGANQDFIFLSQGPTLHGFYGAVKDTQDTHVASRLLKSSDTYGMFRME